MPAVNNNLKLLDLPLWELLQPFPVASASGSCTVTDRRGNNRYMYCLFSTVNFWRYDCWANTFQQLASPITGSMGVGTAMVFDPSLGRIWLLLANTSAPTFQYYDISTNTWTARAVTGLPGTWGIDAHLSHTDETYNVAGNGDYIYLIGNFSLAFYRYSITGNTWATLTSLPLATGQGCSIHWLHGWDNNQLIAIRGGGASDIYSYNISLNSWSASLAYNPRTEGFGLGTMAVPRGVPPDRLLVQKDNTSRVYQFNPATLVMEPVSTQYLLVGSTLITGDRIAYVVEPQSGVEFLYLGLHASTAWLRSPLVVP